MRPTFDTPVVGSMFTRLLACRPASSAGWPAARPACRGRRSRTAGIRDPYGRRSHRELPLTSRDAFSEPGEDGERWIVVDYKTDARPGSHVAYRAQVQIDARVLARATGRPVKGVLFVV